MRGINNMNKKLKIKTCTTAARSLFSSGTVEHNNLIVAEVMENTLEEEKSVLDIALIWTVSAKNALQNHSRHSSNELIFGSNINTPSVLTDWYLDWKM